MINPFIFFFFIKLQNSYYCNINNKNIMEDFCGYINFNGKFIRKDLLTEKIDVSLLLEELKSVILNSVNLDSRRDASKELSEKLNEFSIAYELNVYNVVLNVFYGSENFEEIKKDGDTLVKKVYEEYLKSLKNILDLNNLIPIEISNNNYVLRRQLDDLDKLEFSVMSYVRYINLINPTKYSEQILNCLCNLGNHNFKLYRLIGDTELIIDGINNKNPLLKELSNYLTENKVDFIKFIVNINKDENYKKFKDVLFSKSEKEFNLMYSALEVIKLYELLKSNNKALFQEIKLDTLNEEEGDELYFAYNILTNRLIPYLENNLDSSLNYYLTFENIKQFYLIINSACTYEKSSKLKRN